MGKECKETWCGSRIHRENPTLALASRSFRYFCFSKSKYNLLMKNAGGMERAIEMIAEAKGPGSESVIVDLHPARPDYRGFMAGPNPISMQADPTFSEIEAAGGKVEKNAEAHTVLDDMFLVSGMIPRVTAYENGVLSGIRFENEKGIWEKDEEIADERFLMCNLKGKLILLLKVNILIGMQGRES